MVYNEVDIAIGSKRHSLHAVELSQRSGKPCANCVDLFHPSNGGTITDFFGKPAMRTRWMAGNAPLQAAYAETNPGLTATRKQVWICDTWRRQIQVRKQISIRRNMIEHWVHLRCAGIHLAQYTDTWTCHLHTESRLTTHLPTLPDPGLSR